MPGPAANSTESPQKAPAIPAIPKLEGMGGGLMLGTLVSSVSKVKPCSDLIL